MTSMDEDDMLISEAIQSIENIDDIQFTPCYLPYTYSRVRQILREDFALDMITNKGGYKANRYRNFCTYKLVFIDSGEEYANDVTLHQLRFCLAKLRYPLRSKPPSPSYDKSGRRIGCLEFLKAINMTDKV